MATAPWDEMTVLRPLKGFLAACPSESLFASLFFRSGVADTTLPQDPKADTAARKEQLADAQAEYLWSTEGIPVGMPYLKGFPPADELPKVSWITPLIGVVARTLLGAARGNVGIGDIVEGLSNPARAKTFASRISEVIKDAKPVDIGDYADIHAFPIKTPGSVYDYDDDDAFARQRLQGANCIAIEKCSEATRQKLKILDSDPSYKGMKTKVDYLMAEGKLFVVDLELLKGMEASPLDGEVPRYLAPSVALFEVVEDDLLPIKPLGIQLSQGGTATPIFTPEDGYNWNIAKVCFEDAEFIIYEVVSHLGYTHLVLEGAMVALHRQLAKEHPIHVLLQPHTQGTAFINWGAQEMLMVKGGGGDRLMANRIEDSWEMLVKQTLARISKDFSPEADFEARQVTKEDFPGRYPYRDTGLKYWEAIHTWVVEYLDLYYKSDVDVSADYELQAFVAEMVNIGQMKWLAEFGNSEEKTGLIAKQSRTSFAPNTPGSVYAAPPTDKERTFEDCLAYPSPMEIATSQAIIGHILGSVHNSKLGDYEAHQVSDKRVQKPLAKFQQAIEAIKIDLVDDNSYLVAAWRARGKRKRDAANFGYTTLLADNVPQSTNI